VRRTLLIDVRDAGGVVLEAEARVLAVATLTADSLSCLLHGRVVMTAATGYVE